MMSRVFSEWAGRLHIVQGGVRTWSSSLGPSAAPQGPLTDFLPPSTPLAAKPAAPPSLNAGVTR